MPMIDALIPEGALKPEAEARLVKELTDILITHEGFDLGNKGAQSVSVVFLHRPAAVYVAGTRSPSPRYRIIPTVPEGQYTDASRKALVKEVTEAVVRADGGKYEDVGRTYGCSRPRFPMANGAAAAYPPVAGYSGFHRRRTRAQGWRRTAGKAPPRQGVGEGLEGALDATRKGTDA